MELSFAGELDKHFARAKEIMLGKRKLRGHENITRQGFHGVLTRLKEDKLTRIERFAEARLVGTILKKWGAPETTINEVMKGQEVRPQEFFDSVMDDLYDVMNYALILIMMLDGTWGKD